jgi:hypothetical protein
VHTASIIRVTIRALMMETAHTSDMSSYFNKIQGTISQKVIIFKPVAVRT